MHATRAAILALVFALVAGGCASGDKKDGEGSLGGKGGGGGDEGGGGAVASANRVTLTGSLSNNPLTSETISTAKAESEVQRFPGSSKDKRVIEGRISAERLARKGAGEVMGSAKRLAELEMEKGAGRTISEDVKLEVALAALQSHNFALAEYYLQELSESKTAKVKAGAFNALGVVALKDERVPEAVLYFKEALKASPGYKPALLNLGFAALKGGDLAAAKSALGGMQNDWFVQYGLITVARLDGNDTSANSLCGSVLEKEPGHIAALYNCALFEYQNKHNSAKAKEYLNRAGKAKGGETGWGERAFMLIGKIDQEEAEVKKEAARRAAEKAAAEKAKQKPPAPAPGAPPPAAGGPPKIEANPKQ